MADIEELAARVERLESRDALQRLAYDYCVGADHRDLGRWRSIWTDDAVWETSPDRTFTGIDEICGAVAQQWQAFPVMQHATSNHTVEVDGDTATGRCDVVVLVQIANDRWILGGGAYADEYRRDDGRWRIARRRVVRLFDLGPLTAMPPLPE